MVVEKKLFRDKQGKIKPMLTHAEGISYRENPLDFFIMLARYKFAARLLEKGSKVLEVGCGHGFGSVFLARFSGVVYATDVDEKLIRCCKRKYEHIQNLNFFQLDILKPSSHWNFEDEFDVVVMLDVIEHFLKSEGAQVLKNTQRFLKHKGFLVIGTPNKASQQFASMRRKSTHPFEYDFQEFRDSLQKYFPRVFIFSMTDETVSTGFPQMAWYLMGLCIK